MERDPMKRRKERQQKAEKRANQQKKMLIRLAIAAGILVLCVILLIVLIPKDKDKQSTQQTQPAQVAPAAPQEGVTTAHIVFGGDLNVTDSVVASGGASYDYTQTFIDVAHLFGGADVAAVNLEGILYGEPYGSAGEGSAPQQLMEALDSAGVDLVQVANSYTLNRGMSGLGYTLNGVREAGMEPVGAYATAQEAKEQGGYVICDVGGIRVAFVAFTKGMGGYSLPKDSAGCVNVLYKDYNDNYQEVDVDGISKVLRAVEQEDVDLTVAMLHWGSEHNDTISESQKEILTLMQENGVDAVIGTHAHRVQQMVFDPVAGTFVAYCLGDLIGDASRAGAEYSVILDLEITKNNETGEAKISGFSYTPIYTVREEGEPLRVVRIDEAMKAYENGYIDAVSEETYNSMKNALSRIEARTKGE